MLATVVALASVALTVPGPQAATPAVDALRARRAVLVDQLTHLAAAKSDAAQALLTAQNSLLAVQGQILSVQRDIKVLNDRLMVVSARIADDEGSVLQARRQLAGMTRASYESSSDNAFIASLLESPTVGDAVDRLKAEKHVNQQVSDLVDRVREKDRAIIQERQELKDSFGRSSDLETQLGAQGNRLLELVAARDAAYAHTSGPVQAISRQIADLDQQIAAASEAATETLNQATGHPSSTGGPPCGNHFAFGQCTYYVATRRCIPWLGNARDWPAAAAHMGFAEGHTPAAGAVVAFAPGVDGASGVGHVGYVEHVNPDGSFLMSEMNFAGWDRVNNRTLRWTPGITFIYGRG